VIECVPNFSEGKDLKKVYEIVQAIGSSPGVYVLGWEADADHNRSVITFAGERDAVLEGAVRGVGRAAELIHLPEHVGVHPRVGAADVIPFIPLDGETLEDCVGVAHHAGELIWKRYGVPAYFYEAAALRPERTRLEKTRRSGFDGKPPDVGDIAEHPTAGASMIGARNILIAYNVDLETKDRAVAHHIAKKIRESNGGFRYVKAIGLYLATRDCAQVSMNLTRYEDIPLMELLAAIDREAVFAGTKAGLGELIGFIPKKAFNMAPAFFERAANYKPSQIIETRIEELRVRPTL
jgi:glutamate formiminotransferase